VLVSNVGSVEIEETTTALSEPISGDTISYVQIQTLSSDAGGLPAPALSDGPGPGNFVSITPNVGLSVIDRTATWTYDYTNPAVPPTAGDYTGQVTYTAAAP